MKLLIVIILQFIAVLWARAITNDITIIFPMIVIGIAGMVHVYQFKEDKNDEL